jgi:hypothetical protein
MDSELLVVSARRKPQLHGAATHRQFLGEEITPIELGAVSGDHIDLAGLVLPVDQTFTTATASSGPNGDHVPCANSPFALDAQ